MIVKIPVTSIGMICLERERERERELVSVCHHIENDDEKWGKEEDLRPSFTLKYL